MIPGCKLASNTNLGLDIRALGGARKEGSREPVSSETSKDVKTASPGRKSYTDVQSAARFPVKLPIALKSDSGICSAETQNVSANGVLFEVDAEMPVGSSVDFTISLPADVVGAENDVRVDCRGRVVRSFADGGRRGVGVVIDEYRFERR